MPADYTFQTECGNAISSSEKGVIVLPTGAGKSRIEFNHIFDKIDGAKNPQVFIITAPRIVLCQQLIEDFIEGLLNRYNLDQIADSLMFVSSGELPVLRHPITGDRLNLDECAVADTKPALVTTRVSGAIKRNEHIFIFSTYASFDPCIRGVTNAKRKASKNVDVHLIADEAHFFTAAFDWQDDYDIDPVTQTVRTIVKPYRTLEKNLALFKTRFFFTATPKIKIGSNSSGLNNDNVFGPLPLFTRYPKDLIPKNVICAPDLMKADLPLGANEGNMDQWVGNFILDTFYTHRTQIRKDCGDMKIAKTLGGKLLVCITGSKQLYQLTHAADKDGMTFVDKARADGINVAWTMSNQKNVLEDSDGEQFEGEIKPCINKQPYNRISDFLDNLKAICQEVTYNNGKHTKTKDSENLIILHYDQLTEGIDIPSMSGLLILRPMDEVKAYQSIGRVLRMHPEDRPKDFVDREHTWIKPRSHIIVPKLKELDVMCERLLVKIKQDTDSLHQITDITEAIGTGADIEENDRLVKLVPLKELPGTVEYEITQLISWTKKIDKQVEDKNIIDITL